MSIVSLNPSDEKSVSYAVCVKMFSVGNFNP